jgi:hypothetical protein
VQIDDPSPSVTRVQTGVRVEARMLNVLKALAALKGMSLGDLLEGIVLHALEGECAFSEHTLSQISDLKKVYGLELRARDSHRLVETESEARRVTAKRARAAKSSPTRKSGRSK